MYVIASGFVFNIAVLGGHKHTTTALRHAPHKGDRRSLRFQPITQQTAVSGVRLLQLVLIFCHIYTQVN